MSVDKFRHWSDDGCLEERMTSISTAIFRRIKPHASVSINVVNCAFICDSFKTIRKKRKSSSAEARFRSPTPSIVHPIPTLLCVESIFCREKNIAFYLGRRKYVHSTNNKSIDRRIYIRRFCCRSSQAQQL